MVHYTLGEATHISEQAEFLRKEIHDRWNGKVYPNECSTKEYDINRGFKISTSSRRDECIWTTANIEVLKEIDILIWTSAETSYKRANGH